MSTAAQPLLDQGKPRQGREEVDWEASGRWIAALVLAGSIFWVDSSRCFHGATAVLYVLVLLVVGTSLRQSAIAGWSLACAMLTIAGPVIHPCAGVVLRLAPGLAANFVTTVLLLWTRRTHLRLRASEWRYRTIFDTLALAIWEHDFSGVQDAIADLRADGVTDLAQYIADHPEFVRKARRMVRITDVNATALSMMGVPSKDAFFSRLSGFLPDTDESFTDCILAIDERRETFQAETRVVPRGGPPIDIIVTFGLGGTGPLTRIPGCVLNVSERKRLEATVAKTRVKLERAQRAELLGAVTASIAHEINQPLAAIQGFADATRRWLMRETPNLEQANEALCGLSEAVSHAREVVRRTRTLVGHSKTEAVPIDLNTLLSDAAEFMRQEAAAHQARVVLEPVGECNLVSGDRILLQQVVVNLITNALQAMESVDPARRLVRLAAFTLEKDAFVRVTDTGPGWQDDLQEWLLDPFITTKPQGMGLGLSICRSVLEAHAGDIRLRDAPSGGAEVEFVLPALI